MPIAVVKYGVHKIVLFFIKFEFEIRKNDGWGHFFSFWNKPFIYIYIYKFVYRYIASYSKFKLINLVEQNLDTVPYIHCLKFKHLSN